MGSQGGAVAIEPLTGYSTGLTEPCGALPDGFESDSRDIQVRATFLLPPGILRPGRSNIGRVRLNGLISLFGLALFRGGFGD
jgi:hypothetical protein